MYYQLKEIQLKDGTSAILRNPRKEDGESMMKYHKISDGETEFLSRYPEEKKYTIVSEMEKIQRMLESEDCLMLVCEINGEIVGNCQIVFMNTIKTKHRATVMIGVLKKYWSLQIGSRMFEEMIKIAKEHGVQQLELQVIEGNEQAIALYKKYGFEVVAQIPNAYRLKDGTYRKEIFMIKNL